MPLADKGSVPLRSDDRSDLDLEMGEGRALQTVAVLHIFQLPVGGKIALNRAITDDDQALSRYWEGRGDFHCGRSDRFCPYMACTTILVGCCAHEVTFDREGGWALQGAMISRHNFRSI